MNNIEYIKNISKNMAKNLRKNKIFETKFIKQNNTKSPPGRG